MPISSECRHLLRFLAIAVLLVAGIAESRARLTLTPLAPPPEVLPRQTVNLVLSAENSGDASWEGLLQATVPPGWRLLVPPAPVALAPGESVTVVFTLLVSQEASAGTYEISVAAEGEDSALALFRLSVTPVARLEATVLQAPELVVAGSYTAVFLLTNSGNVAARLALTVEDNLGLHLEAQPAEIELAGGTSERVTVRANVPDELRSYQVHRLTLIAEETGAATRGLAASAMATIELIPYGSDLSRAFHLFPMRFSSSAQVNLWNLRSDPSRALERAEVELRGEGKLWELQPGTFRIRLGAGLRSEQQQALVEYRHDEFRVALGRQWLRQTPLFPEFEGFGASAGAELWPDNVLRARGEGYLLSGEGGGRIGGSAELSLEETLRASIQVSIGEKERHLGTRWRVLPTASSASEIFQPVALEVEYVRRQTETGEVGRALWLGGGFAVPPVELDVGFRAREGSYDDRSSDSSTFALSGTAAFGLSFPQELSVSYRRNNYYLLGSLAAGSRLLEGFDSTLDLMLEGTLGASELGLEYSRANSASYGGTARPTGTERFGVTLGTFLEDDAQLQQRFGLKKETAGRTEAHYSFYYSGGLRTLSAGGHLTSEVDLEYAREERTFSRLDLRTEWSGPVVEELELTVGAELGLVGDRLSQIDLQVKYTPDSERDLRLELHGFLYRGRGPRISAAASYSQAFDVPLFPLSTVGRVSGTLTDASGRGLDRLVVRLAGRSAVTQDDGSFLFPAVPAGDHQLIVHPDSLPSNHLTLPATPLPLQVEAGSEVEVELEVVEAARLQGEVRFTVPEDESGTVVYGQGRPERESALVSGVLLQLSNGEMTLRDVSDTEGRFQFRRLPPGDWRLVASAEHLSELYRLEPAEQTLGLVAGENRFVIELLPRARSIQIIEGGVVGREAEPGAGGEAEPGAGDGDQGGD